MIIATGAYAGEAEHDRVRRLVQKGELMPLEKLIARALEVHPGSMLEAELEQHRGRLTYEIEVLDAEGRVWELVYDAKSGELLKSGPER